MAESPTEVSILIMPKKAYLQKSIIQPAATPNSIGKATQ